MQEALGERLARVEVRVDHHDKTLSDRQMIISSHSRRVADTEQHIVDIQRRAHDLTTRVAILEKSDEITREERSRKRHQRALIQYAISIASAAAVAIGLVTAREQGVISTILGMSQ